MKEENRRTLERLHQAEETVRTVTLKNSELQEHLKKLESVKPVKDNSEEVVKTKKSLIHISVFRSICTVYSHR